MTGNKVTGSFKPGARARWGGAERRDFLKGNKDIVITLF